jgi:hypothetical protein
MSAPAVDHDLNHLYPDFRAQVAGIVLELNRWCSVHWPGHGAMVYEGFRTQARQQYLYAQGRTAPGDIVTDKNGTTNLSNHQKCLAADIVGVTNGQPSWDCPSAFWAYLQHLAHLDGLTSGSDWTGLVDQPHVEVKTSQVTTYAVARVWKKNQGLV